MESDIGCPKKERLPRPKGPRGITEVADKPRSKIEGQHEENEVRPRRSLTTDESHEPQNDTASTRDDEGGCPWVSAYEPRPERWIPTNFIHGDCAPSLDVQGEFASRNPRWRADGPRQEED